METKEVAVMRHILSDAELYETTHLKRHSAQARYLQSIGVPYRLRPDGSLLVSVEALHRALSGHIPNNAAPAGFNWSRT